MAAGNPLTQNKLLIDLILHPEIAAISMSGSSLLVALNALMLKNTKLEGTKAKPQSL